jgi:Xaa-Pro aminopeptidase
MKSFLSRRIAGGLIILGALAAGFAAAGRDDLDTASGVRVLSLREQAAQINAWMENRLTTLLPALMRRAGIDLWIVLSREYQEDPLYFTMVPRPALYSSGTVALLFHDKGPQAGVERLCSAPHGLAGGYTNIWKPRVKSQFETLADYIRRVNPKRIGIDASSRWPLADGLTVSLKDRLEDALGPEWSPRLVSAEDLCVGWLETRTADEQIIYRDIGAVAHSLIAEFFSDRVIIPGKTTEDDVVWWIRQRVASLGLESWFQPSVEILRSKKKSELRPGDKVIRPGDLLHCDFGIRYLSLCTDMQWQAYVLKPGETDAPAGLKKALANANRVADILMAEFKAGRMGSEIAAAAMAKGQAEGLNLTIYTHPIGFNGHAAGCTPDARDPRTIDEANVPKWSYPLYPETAYSIEFNCKTPAPEWDNEDVYIGYEEDAIFTAADGCRFIDGRQTKFILIPSVPSGSAAGQTKGPLPG